MIDYQKINMLYKNCEDKPFQNKELVSLFEQSFKKALKNQSLNDIKKLFHYDYAYKMLESIYQQFHINDEIMELILPTKDKNMIATLENLCPRLMDEVGSYMLERDSILAYQFLKHHHSEQLSIINMTSFEVVYKMTSNKANQVFKYFINHDLSSKNHQHHIISFVNNLVMAQNEEILDYTLNHQKKYLIDYIVKNSLDDSSLKNAITMSYSIFPHTGCVWINFAFSDNKLKVIQDLFEFDLAQAPQDTKYTHFYEKIEESLQIHLEKRALDKTIKKVNLKETKMKI